MRGQHIMSGARIIVGRRLRAAAAIAGLMTMGLSIPLAMPAAAAAATQGAGTQKPDETPIREVVKKYVDAREQRDAAALAALFTESIDQLVSSGEWRKGRDAVVKGTLASSQASGGVRTIEVETVQFPAPGIAIADGRYEIAGLQGGATRKMWSTFVMARQADGWKIAAIRNMLPAAPVPAAPTSK